MKKIISILIIGILVISGLGVNGLSLKNLSRPSIIENYDMVIIAPDMFSDALQPLINHKNLLGIETFLKTTENIYSTYDGRDKPEQIKYCIKYMIETFEIKYVLLIGDIQKTPIRKTEVNHIWGSPENHLFYQVDDIITDLYYADIYNSNGTFSSWDSNNDNIFSEHYLYNEGETLEERVIVDEVDLYPDVGVGRIPCKTIEELDIVVHKIITYETQDNNDYFHNIILAGCDGFPEPGYQCEMITERISDVMNNFTQVKLYESMDNLNPSLINREINNGAGFFFCESHGSPYAFHDYLKSNIKKLHNNNKLPIAFLGGCYCACLDYSMIYHFQVLLLALCMKFINNPVLLLKFNNLLHKFNSLDLNPKNIWPCISWELLKHQEGGSIATIGHTRAGQIVRDNPPSGFSGLFSIMFFESYKPGITLSQMYNDAIISFIDDSWKNYVTLQEHIVLGDPSLKIGGYNTL
jgi:hypothetical protein